VVGQVAVSPIEGSTSTDYVVRNAVLHCSLSGEGILPSRLPGCECPLDIRSWLTHCSDQLSYRPLTCLFSPIRRRLKRLQLVVNSLIWSHSISYAPGTRNLTALSGTKNPASISFPQGYIFLRPPSRDFKIPDKCSALFGMTGYAIIAIPAIEPESLVLLAAKPVLLDSCFRRNDRGCDCSETLVGVNKTSELF
jgi:hypothetical protein